MVKDMFSRLKMGMGDPDHIKKGRIHVSGSAAFKLFIHGRLWKVNKLSQKACSDCWRTINLKLNWLWYTSLSNEDGTPHHRWLRYGILSSCLASTKRVNLSLVYWQWFRLCSLYQASCSGFVSSLKFSIVCMDVVWVSGDSRRRPIWRFMHWVSYRVYLFTLQSNSCTGFTLQV